MHRSTSHARDSARSVRRGPSRRGAVLASAAAGLLALAACAPPTGGPAAGTTDDGWPGGSDGGGSTESAHRTRILLLPDLGLDGTVGDGAPSVTAEQVAGFLATGLGAPEADAECEEGLVLQPEGSWVRCTGPGGPTSLDDDAPWVATVVQVPTGGELHAGTHLTLLFTSGTELPAAMDEMLAADVMLTAGPLDDGIDQAADGVTTPAGEPPLAFEPLTAEELAAQSLAVLTSGEAVVPVADAASWASVTCSRGMDPARFRPVECEARDEAGDLEHLLVAPGILPDGRPGLLVGIRTLEAG